MFNQSISFPYSEAEFRETVKMLLEDGRVVLEGSDLEAAKSAYWQERRETESQERDVDRHWDDMQEDWEKFIRVLAGEETYTDELAD